MSSMKPDISNVLGALIYIDQWLGAPEPQLQRNSGPSAWNLV